MGLDADASSLHAAILEAHDNGDGPALARLYVQAADFQARAGDEEAAGFFLVQAYVFALESGSPDAAALHARLKARGREA